MTNDLGYRLLLIAILSEVPVTRPQAELMYEYGRDSEICRRFLKLEKKGTDYLDPEVVKQNCIGMSKAEVKKQIYQLYGRGHTARELADVFEYSVRTIYRIVKKEQEKVSWNLTTNQ